MTINHVGRSAVVNGTTSLAVPLGPLQDPSGNPVAFVAGDLLLISVTEKYPPNVPTTPTSWAFGARGSGGVGAAGSQSGPVSESVYWVKATSAHVAAAASNGTITVPTPSGTMAQGSLIALHNTDATTPEWDLAFATGADPAAANAYAITFGSDPGFQSGDVAMVFQGINASNLTFPSAPTLTAGASTVGSQSTRFSTPNTSLDGTHHRGDFYRITGSPSGGANPTFTLTSTTSSATAPTGAAVLVRVRVAASVRVITVTPDTAARTIGQTFTPTASYSGGVGTPTLAWSATGPSTNSAQFSNTASTSPVFTPAGGPGTYTLRATEPATGAFDETVVVYTAAAADTNRPKHVTAAAFTPVGGTADQVLADGDGATYLSILDPSGTVTIAMEMDGIKKPTGIHYERLRNVYRSGGSTGTATAVLKNVAGTTIASSDPLTLPTSPDGVVEATFSPAQYAAMPDADWPAGSTGTGYHVDWLLAGS